jgi:hypothetical protein
VCRRIGVPPKNEILQQLNTLLHGSDMSRSLIACS